MIFRTEKCLPPGSWLPAHETCVTYCPWHRQNDLCCCACKCSVVEMPSGPDRWCCWEDHLLMLELTNCSSWHKLALKLCRGVHPTCSAVCACHWVPVVSCDCTGIHEVNSELVLCYNQPTENKWLLLIQTTSLKRFIAETFQECLRKCRCWHGKWK